MRSTTTNNALPIAATPLDATRVASRRSPRWLGVALITATVLGCLATLEVGLRLIGRYQSRSIDGFHAEEGISYGLKKNVSTRVFWPTHSYLVATDAFGFRSDRTGPRDLTAKPYYAVLGSSDAFGNGLDYEKTFIGVLGRKMAAHETDVVNLAVGGHHFLEQAARYKEFSTRVPAKPKVVMIVLNPLMIKGFDDIHPNVVVRRGELFEKEKWRLPLAKMILANTSAAYSFLRDGIRNVQLRYFNRADFSVDFYLDVYAKTLRIRTPEATAAFSRQMTDLETYIRGQGATPVCVYSPATGGFLVDKLLKEGTLDASILDTQFYRELARRHCAAAGLQFVDLEPMLQARYDRGEKLNFDLDAHFNEPTSLAVGEYLYASVKP